jgi:uncharacterized protein
MVSIPEGHILTLGGFTFKASTVPIEAIRKQSAFDWSSQDRGKRSPAKQWSSLGNRTITIEGTIYPEYDPGSGNIGSLIGPVGRFQLETLDSMAQAGEPYLLVDGTGLNLGKWIITSINEDQEYLLINGVPRKQKFNITLERYGGEVSIKQNLLNRARQAVRDTRGRITRNFDRLTTVGI